MPRAFIVATGPSLNWTPLDRLAAEVTYSFNKIYLMFDKTKWRPSYWVIADLSAQDKWPMDGVFQHGSKYIVRADFHEAIDKYVGGADVEWVPRCEQHDHKNCQSEGTPKSWHLPTYCRFGGGMFIAIQHAVMHGYNPLYLVGADLYRENDLDEAKWADVNHFSPEYGVKMPSKYGSYDRFNQTLILAHRNALDGCHERGVEIYNATLGGSLEIYPRVNLGDILGQKEA